MRKIIICFLRVPRRRPILNVPAIHTITIVKHHQHPAECRSSARWVSWHPRKKRPKHCEDIHGAIAFSALQEDRTAGSHGSIRLYRRSRFSSDARPRKRASSPGTSGLLAICDRFRDISVDQHRAACTSYARRSSKVRACIHRDASGLSHPTTCAGWCTSFGPYCSADCRTYQC